MARDTTVLAGQPLRPTTAVPKSVITRVFPTARETTVRPDGRSAVRPAIRLAILTRRPTTVLRGRRSAVRPAIRPATPTAARTTVLPDRRSPVRTAIQPATPTVGQTTVRPDKRSAVAPVTRPAMSTVPPTTAPAGMWCFRDIAVRPETPITALVAYVQTATRLPLRAPQPLRPRCLLPPGWVRPPR